MLLIGDNPLVLVHAMAFSSSIELQQPGAAVGRCPSPLWPLPLPFSPPVTLVGAAQRRPQPGAPWVQRLGCSPNSPLPGFIYKPLTGRLRPYSLPYGSVPSGARRIAP